LHAYNELSSGSGSCSNTSSAAPDNNPWCSTAVISEEEVIPPQPTLIKRGGEWCDCIIAGEKTCCIRGTQ